ncbi:uncharacterized protein LOC113299146 isoform X3 [Papaver somniferum]|uniref:uncharacterized protein LOC113299146 isoform X3 n=1 Tax=Papaver somniferum TaxID=3469 RepID=UPI000E6FBA91|nr:uncharacterized protein LOC113299146 isoform X3 [Papaver somniferum]
MVENHDPGPSNQHIQSSYADKVKGKKSASFQDCNAARKIIKRTVGTDGNRTEVTKQGASVSQWKEVGRKEKRNDNVSASVAKDNAANSTAEGVQKDMGILGTNEQVTSSDVNRSNAAHNNVHSVGDDQDNTTWHQVKGKNCSGSKHVDSTPTP